MGNYPLNIINEAKSQKKYISDAVTLILPLTKRNPTMEF